MPVVASAQGSRKAGQIIDDLAGCKAIARDQERLACLDRASAELLGARERKEVVIIDGEEVRNTRRSLFGFSIPRIALFGGRDDDKDEPEIKEVTTVITSTTDLGLGKWALTMEDGSRWQTTEATQIPPRKGASIRIKRGAVGSYFIYLGSSLMVRAKRIG